MPRPGNTLLRLQKDDVRALEDALDSWRGEDSEEALCALEFELIVSRSLETPAGFRRLCRVIWTAARANQLDDYQWIGEAVRALGAGAVQVLRLAHREGQEFARRTGHTINRLDELEAAAREIEQLVGQLLGHWPWIDAQRVQEALAEYQRGEYQEYTDAAPDPGAELR